MRILFLLVAYISFSFAQAPSPAPASAPSSPAFWFIDAGETSAADRILGLGLARPLNADVEAFFELAADSKTAAGTTGSVFLGLKTNLPAIKKVTPFALTAYGASVHSLVHISTLTPVTGTTPVAVVTSIGQNPVFAQRYGIGLEFPVGGFKMGIGGTVDLAAPPIGRRAYPFLFIARTFGGKQ